MRNGVPDVPKIAPIIEIKESYFHQKPEPVVRRQPNQSFS